MLTVVRVKRLQSGLCNWDHREEYLIEIIKCNEDHKVWDYQEKRLSAIPRCCDVDAGHSGCAFGIFSPSGLSSMIVCI